MAYETGNQSRSTPDLLAGGHGSTGAGTSSHLTARPLLAPDEAIRLPLHVQALLRSGHPPALVAKLRHYADAEFAGLANK